VSPVIGFIGLGLMGRPMARNLLKAGFPLVVHNRSRAPVEDLAAQGARAAASPADVARQSTRIVTMLPDSPDVERVLEGPDGVFGALQPGSIVVDTSSISPDVARRLSRAATGLGATMLDAPVSGGEIGAIDGTLTIMVGGDASAFEEVRPILDAMGNPDRVTLIGDAGAGQTCKLCNQMVLGATLAAVGEAFTLARKAGVDPAKVRHALLGGFAASRVLEVHGERIITRNYVPGFRAELFLKDYRNVLASLDSYGLAAPVSRAVEQLLDELVGDGQGRADYSALATVLFKQAGLES
jgi:2-hydroxy-3-oxopropionate reductase